MRTRYDAWMDGVAMSSLHDDLAVLDIEYEAPSISNTVFKRAQGSGGYVGDRYQESSGVTIHFELHIYDPAERQRVCAAVCKWAQGRILQTTDRPDQRLLCICDEYPAISSASKWTDPLAVVFRAYSIPYWQEQNPVMVTLTGTLDDDTLYVPGNAGYARVEAEISAVEALTSVTLTAGQTSIVLSGMSVPAEGVIRIYYDDEGFLRITLGSTSIMDKRTGDDDLLVPCGERSAVSLASDGTCTCRFSVRGLWL